MKKWIPKHRDTYYFCSEKRGIIEDIFDEYDSNKKARVVLNNAFRTRDEASRHYDEVIHNINFEYIKRRNLSC